MIFKNTNGSKMIFKYVGVSVSAGSRAVDNCASSAGIAHNTLVVKSINVCFRKPF